MTHTVIPINSPADSPIDRRTTAGVDPAFVTMLGRLSRLSVGKGVDAYGRRALGHVTQNTPFCSEK